MKTFEEFLAEKVALHDGVRIEKDKSHTGTIQHNGEMVKQVKHNVYVNDQHIGHTLSTSITPHKKITGSRLVKPMAAKIMHGTYYKADENGGHHMRGSWDTDVHHQANMMAAHHKRKPE